MNPIIIYIVLFVIAAAYAYALNTKQGKIFATEYTWASVVIGQVLILAALYFILPSGEWLKVVIVVVVAGIPMIGRSLLNKNKRK